MTTENQSTYNPDDYVTAKFPAAFIKQIEQNGYEKARIELPPKFYVNGVDLSGYAIKKSMTDNIKRQMLEGSRQINFKFAKDKPVEVYKGRGDTLKVYKVSPWVLAASAKRHREAYKARAQREEATAQKETVPAQETKAPPKEARPPALYEKVQSTKEAAHTHTQATQGIPPAQRVPTV
jgi:hypothetical protein